MRIKADRRRGDCCRRGRRGRVRINEEEESEESEAFDESKERNCSAMLVLRRVQHSSPFGRRANGGCQRDRCGGTTCVRYAPDPSVRVQARQE